MFLSPPLLVSIDIIEYNSLNIKQEHIYTGYVQTVWNCETPGRINFIFGGNV